MTTHAARLDSVIRVSPLQSVQFCGKRIFVKRDDLLHPIISGNKYRKLKYAIRAIPSSCDTILSFGGPYSNHIHALAHVGNITKLKTIGYIRGNEISNQTLDYCRNEGMRLKFKEANVYRNLANSTDFVNKQLENGIYVLPEGGDTVHCELGVLELFNEIVDQLPSTKVIVVAVGTGCTFEWLVQAASGTNIHIIGVNVVSNTMYPSIVKRVAKQTCWSLYTECCGGYGHVGLELWRKLDRYQLETGLVLEPIYGVKMLSKLEKLMNSGEFSCETGDIVFIHSGGLQGLAGLEPSKKRVFQANRK